ncbi:MAG: hypothetical protein OHK93_002822 [Ramalina farinacea]|uniref:Uncharacterized protein n=1 Tax=Ramalina farinacea TaxID=258253 RepID=A0AA43TXJ5_9LECA|nr:hypothetical protein [Ramalina farinacea]
MADAPITLPEPPTTPATATTLPKPPTMPAPSSPSDLLLRRNQALIARLITLHYSEHLHAWLIAKGEKAYSPFSGSMTWEHFRITIAPYLCSMEMPHASMRIPLPCRKIGQDPRRWMNVTLKEAKRGGFIGGTRSR